MFKMIITMKRRPGMSFEDFVRYYNEKHLANVAAILPETGIRATLHRRNFIISDDPLLSVIGDDRVDRDPPFDVFTEVEFESREDAEKGWKTFFDAQYFEKIKEDERNFVVLPSVTFYVVEVEELKIA